MGAKSPRSTPSNADDRQFKRRLNELEEDLKKLQKAVQTLKKSRRQIGHYRKEAERARVREHDLQETLELIDGEVVSVENRFLEQERKDSVRFEGSRYHCRQAGCNSVNVREITAGSRIVVICDDCDAKFTIVLEKHQGSSFAKTG